MADVEIGEVTAVFEGVIIVKEIEHETSVAKITSTTEKDVFVNRTFCDYEGMNILRHPFRVWDNGRTDEAPNEYILAEIFPDELDIESESRFVDWSQSEFTMYADTKMLISAFFTSRNRSVKDLYEFTHNSPQWMSGLEQAKRRVKACLPDEKLRVDSLDEAVGILD